VDPSVLQEPRVKSELLVTQERQVHLAYQVLMVLKAKGDTMDPLVLLVSQKFNFFTEKI
jgi:hypothetical protein